MFIRCLLMVVFFVALLALYVCEELLVGNGDSYAKVRRSLILVAVLMYAVLGTGLGSEETDAPG